MSPTSGFQKVQNLETYDIRPVTVVLSSYQIFRFRFIYISKSVHAVGNPCRMGGFLALVSKTHFSQYK